MKLDEDALRAGYRINCFETLRSTSDEALRRATLGDRGRLWIVAAAQSGGRGRQGRSWSSPRGNVYASLLLVDPVAPALASQLGFVAGAAAAAAFQPYVSGGSILALKWPNDVLVNGAKLAGILVEASRVPNGAFACTLGFGVNRVSHPTGTPYPVTNLHAVSPLRPTVDDVVEALSGSLHRHLAIWDGGRGFDRIRRLWLDHALPAGTSLTVTLNQQRVAGRFVTIDERGRLVLAGDQGHLHIEAGDVLVAAQPDQASEGAR